jgi:hypothetical protein
LYSELGEIEINSFAEWAPRLVVTKGWWLVFIALAVLFERDNDGFMTTVGVKLGLDVI